MLTILQEGTMWVVLFPAAHHLLPQRFKGSVRHCPTLEITKRDVEGWLAFG
jgi:hypothetical protein